MIENIFDGLNNAPAIFHIEGGLSGALYLTDTSRLGILMEAEELGFKDVISESILGSINGAHIKVIQPRPGAGSVWWPSDHDTVGQTTLRYKYALVGTVKEALKEKSVSRLTLFFPELFFMKNDEKQPDMVVGGKRLNVTIHSWPKAKKTLVNIEFPNELIQVDDIYGYVTRVERFFTSTLGVVARVEKVLYRTPSKRDVLYIAGSRPIAVDVAELPQKANMSIFGETGRVELLVSYLESTKLLGHAAHLHGTYIEYREDNVYLDSRLSVLFAGIDSVFSKLKRPATKGEVSRAAQYDTFLEAVSSEVSISPSALKKFLAKKSTKDAYIKQVSFKDKLNFVYDFAGAKRLDDNVSTRFNSLRNDIAHGNDYDFGDYLQEQTDDSTGVTQPAITYALIEGMADTLWASIQKLAIGSKS